MKLTGKLKSEAEAANSKEAKKAIIADAGMELTDEELDIVSGGKTYYEHMKECGNCGRLNEIEAKICCHCNSPMHCKSKIVTPT